MRTFSKLRRECSYPEVIEKKVSYARDKAAGIGTYFHAEASRYVLAALSGVEWVPNPGDEDTLVGAWLRRLTSNWKPAPGCESEIPLGLGDDDGPVYVPVTETEPNSHIYMPDDGMTKLLTAGRADLIMPGIRDAVDVVDLKTGQSYLGPPKEIPQLLGQGLAATMRAGASGFVPIVYYARLGLWDRGDAEPIWRGSQEWSDAWWKVVASAKMDLTPRVGGWCLGCYSRKECSAFGAMVVT